ncbi:iron complex outermembrane receptor protein [Pedobacter cryoconitis]|uniref:TonB-dependent receptor n=1 Tax=Pedobacter cryoconitis TaxID=188932 RepID=UPI00160EC34E|nr:TonB-dependent receptor [Pedobacter cryoconitis]MBB6271481.1 iron complex outermembrane receptor protein [Pedobacter cryoconitis]
MPKKLLSLIFILFLSTQLFAQHTGSVKGRITTSDGTVADGVTVKLKGTTFGAVTEENGSYSIRKVPAGEYTLVVSAIGLYPKEKQITVTRETVIADFSLNENKSQLKDVQISTNKKYKVEKVSSSLRLQTKLLELPQNIKVVTSQLMADQMAFDIVDGVTRNVSGAVRVGHWDAQYANILMRGFSIPAFRNGMNLKTPWGPLADDAATIDRIEFVKGPAGFMMANGEPGGLYNIVTKKPTGMNQSSVSLSAGGYNLARAAVDLDTRLSADGKLLFRLNVAAQTKGSFNKYNYNDKYVIAPVISYQIDSNTKVTAEYTHQHVEALALGNYGFSPKGFGDTDPSFFVGDPSLDPNKLNDHNLTLYFNHKFNKDWTFNAQAAYLNYSLVGSSVWPSMIAANGDMKRGLNISEELAINKNIQFSVQGEFKTGEIVHRVLGGMDMGNLKTWGDFSSTSQPDLQLANGTFNIYNPVYGIPAANIPVFDRSRSIQVRSGANTYATNSTYTGAYLQDELRFLNEKLRLTLAGRFTHAETVGKTNATEMSDNAFTPRVGLSYSITKDFSAYTLYDQSFIPQSQASRSATGEVFKPVTGNNIEFGLKKDWFEGKWNSTFSIYKIKKKNVLTPDPAYPLGDPNNFMVQLGEVESKGIEFDLVGEIARGLNLTLNYAYTDPKVTRDENKDPAKNATGTYLANTAKHITNGWLSYRYRNASSIFNGIGFAGGYQMQFRRYAGSGPTQIPFADYIRFDAGISYVKGKFEITGLVSNLLDRKLFTQGSYTKLAKETATAVSYYTYIYEVPRNGRISVKYKF